LIILADGGIRCLGSLDKVVPANIRRYMMTVLKRIQSFFKRPKAKAKAEEAKPATKAAEEKATEAPEKKTGESSQKSTSTT